MTIHLNVNEHETNEKNGKLIKKKLIDLKQNKNNDDEKSSNKMKSSTGSRSKCGNGSSDRTRSTTTAVESNNVDDDFNILEDLQDTEEKQRWVQEYVNSLSHFENITLTECVGIELKKSRSSLSSSSEKFPGETVRPTKSNHYLLNNKTFFQKKKNYSFNDYQLWKIRRDNAKIGERLIETENRRVSNEYFRLLRKDECGPLFREEHFIRFNPDNKVK